MEANLFDRFKKNIVKPLEANLFDRFNKKINDRYDVDIWIYPVDVDAYVDISSGGYIQLIDFMYISSGGCVCR